MMNINRNDPKYEFSFTSKIRIFLRIGNAKIRKDNKNTKSHFLEILIKSIQSEVKAVYDRGYRDNLRQFQSYRM